MEQERLISFCLHEAQVPLRRGPGWLLWGKKPGKSGPWHQWLPSPAAPLQHSTQQLKNPSPATPAGSNGFSIGTLPSPRREDPQRRIELSESRHKEEGPSVA